MNNTVEFTFTLKPEYTEAHFLSDFPDDRTCANRLMSARGSNGKIWCSDCNRSTPHFYIEKRHVGVCGRCGTEFDLLKDTIFEGSTVSLRKWFLAIFWIWRRVYISDKELAAKLTVKPSTAAKMQRKVRWRLGGRYIYAHYPTFTTG